MGHKQMTICWDCSKACAGCQWSQCLEPIPGWTATQTKDKDGVISYCVSDCPQFDRDSWEGGTLRHPPLTEEERRAIYRERQRLKSKNKYRRAKESKASAGWAEAALIRAGGAK